MEEREHKKAKSDAETIRNKGDMKVRPGSWASTSIDGKNPHIDPDELHKEKHDLDKQIEKEIQGLQLKMKAHSQVYDAKIDQIRSREENKENLLNVNIHKLREEKTLKDEFFQDRMSQLEKEKNHIESVYIERLEQLRKLLAQKNKELEQQVNHLKKEKRKQERLIAQKIERLKQEKKEIDNLFKKNIAELKQQDSYKEEIKYLKNEALKERDEQSKIIAEMLLNTEDEKNDYDNLYQERIARLMQEMNNKDEGLQEIFSNIRQEQALEINAIQDRIQQLRRDKAILEERYRIQLNKIEEIHQGKKEVAESYNKKQEQKSAKVDTDTKSGEGSFARSFQHAHEKTLQRLNELENYTIADGNPDVRGWKVKGNLGETIGRVVELIVDKDSMKVRYLDIDLDEALLDGDKERHLLIPIGAAKIDDDNDDVLVPILDPQLARKIPGYNGQEVTRDYETYVLTSLSPEYNTAMHQNEHFYDHRHFDDSNFRRSMKR